MIESSDYDDIEQKAAINREKPDAKVTGPQRQKRVRYSKTLNYPCLQLFLSIFRGAWAFLFFVFWQSTFNPDHSSCFVAQLNGIWTAWPTNPGLSSSVKTYDISGMMHWWFFVAFIVQLCLGGISITRSIYGFYRKHTKSNACLAVFQILGWVTDCLLQGYGCYLWFNVGGRLCTQQYLQLTGIVFIAYVVLSEAVYITMFTVHGIKLSRLNEEAEKRKPKAPAKIARKKDHAEIEEANNIDAHEQRNERRCCSRWRC